MEEDCGGNRGGLGSGEHDKARTLLDDFGVNVEEKRLRLGRKAVPSAGADVEPIELENGLSRLAHLDIQLALFRLPYGAPHRGREHGE